MGVFFWKGAAAVTRVGWGGCKEVQRARVSSSHLRLGVESGGASPQSCQQVVCRLIHLPDGADAPCRHPGGCWGCCSCCSLSSRARGSLFQPPQTPWSRRKSSAAPANPPQPLTVGGSVGRDPASRWACLAVHDLWLCPSVLGHDVPHSTRAGAWLPVGSCCGSSGAQGEQWARGARRYKQGAAGCCGWGSWQESPFLPSSSLGTLLLSFLALCLSSGDDFG